MGLVLDQLRHRRSITGEALDELRPPDVDVIRPAVMTQVPNHLGTLALGGLQHGQEARPVVLPRLALDQMPAQAVAHGMQTMAVQFGVVVRGPAVMAGRGEQVEPAAVAAAMVRALETTEKETLEYRGVVHRLPLG